MVTVGDIYDALNEFCPFERHEPWDNAGLLVGSRTQAVKKAAAVLDITAAAVEQAHAENAQLIVSHHPVIFHPLKNVKPDNPVYLLAKYGISAICAHTCLDCAQGGVNDVLAQLLSLSDVGVILSEQAQTPLLRAGNTQKQMSPEQFAREVSKRLGCHVCFADGGSDIRRAAVCGGAGGEFFADAGKAGCQALVTGEAAHHEFIEAAAMGITLVEAGHFETENPVVDVLVDFLGGHFPDLEVVKLSQNPPTEFI